VFVLPFTLILLRVNLSRISVDSIPELSDCNVYTLELNEHPLDELYPTCTPLEVGGTTGGVT